MAFFNVFPQTGTYLSALLLHFALMAFATTLLCHFLWVCMCVYVLLVLSYSSACNRTEINK